MYRKISILPGISILAIVTEHAISFGIIALYYWLHRYQALLPPDFDPYKTPQYYLLIFLKQLFVFGVPVFFFLSGFFVSYASDRIKGNIHWRTIRARIFGLLGPYLFWTVVSVSLEIVLGHTATPIFYLGQFLLGLNGFWFVPALIIFYLLSPWIVYLAKKNWKWLLVFCGCSQAGYIILANLLFSPANSTNPWLRLFVDQKDILMFNWLFYFPMGVVFGLHIAEFKDWLSRNWQLLTTICLTFFCAALSISLWKSVYLEPPEHWTIVPVSLLSHLYSTTLLLSYLGYTSKTPLYSKLLLKVGGYTLGIYLTHYIFMNCFAKLIYNFFPMLLSYQLLFVLFVLTVGLGLSLTLMITIQKSFTKKIYRYIYG
jgi:peptidoglycan/LPS O-acetylase OafA/YrhL